jgi:hypothetical protein
MSTTTVRYLSEDQLIKQAVEALMQSLGPVETTRFMALSRENRMESVARHRQWQQSLNRDAFLDEIFGAAEDAA